MWWLRKKGKLAVLPRHIVLPIWLCLYILTTHGHVPCRHVSHSALFTPDYCHQLPRRIVLLIWLCLYISTTHGHVPCRCVSYKALFILDYCHRQPRHTIYLLSSFLLFTIYTMAWTWLTMKKATGGIATRCLLSKSSSASATPPTTPAVPPATLPTTPPPPPPPPARSPAVPPATLPTTPPPPPPPAHSPAVPPPTLSEQTDLIKNNVIFFCLIHFLSWELTIFLSSAVCASTVAS